MIYQTKRCSAVDPIHQYEIKNLSFQKGWDWKVKINKLNKLISSKTQLTTTFKKVDYQLDGEFCQWGDAAICLLMLYSDLMQTQEIRILAFSDTHSMHDQIQIHQLPHPHLFIHAGDFTIDSERQELQSFRQFVAEIPSEHKVVISGNHDFIFDSDSFKNTYSKIEIEQERKAFQQICHFLEFQMIQVNGITILGINKGPEYFDWKFDFAKAEGEPIIQKYKGKVDVLVTHWPPYGILDQINKKQRGGSKGLLQFVKAISPKIHIFGHIHERRGHIKQFGIDFYNASNATKRYDFIAQPLEIMILPSPKQQ